MTSHDPHDHDHGDTTSVAGGARTGDADTKLNFAVGEPKLELAETAMLGVQFVDFLFNSFPSTFLLMLDVGIVSVVQRYRPVRKARGAPAQRHLDVAASSPMPTELVTP